MCVCTCGIITGDQDGMVGVVAGAVVLNDAAQVILPADGIHNDNKRPRLHQHTLHHLLLSTTTTYSWSQKFTYTYFFTKIRGIIQNASYCFSTDLNKTFHIKDAYIQSTRENSWIYKNYPVQKFTYAWFLILCCYLNDPQLFFLFCFV